jgi:hypothetical protein
MQATADAERTCEKQQELLGIHLQQLTLRQLEDRQGKSEECGRPVHDDYVPHAQRDLVWPVVHEQRQQPFFRCKHTPVISPMRGNKWLREQYKPGRLQPWG